jgi:hypothetical protein
MNLELLSMLAATCLFPLSFVVSDRLNKQAAVAGAQRRGWILQNPHTLTWVQLVQSDGYDAHIVVKTSDGAREGLHGFRGEAAVRKFQELCACTPKAAHVVTINGVNQVVAS